MLPKIINHPSYSSHINSKAESYAGKYLSHANFSKFPGAFYRQNLPPDEVEDDELNSAPVSPKECTIDKCFDMFKCRGEDLKVYIYPEAFASSKFTKASQWSLFERIIYTMRVK